MMAMEEWGFIRLVGEADMVTLREANEKMAEKDTLIARLKEMLIEERALYLAVFFKNAKPWGEYLPDAKEQIEKELKEPEQSTTDPRQKYIDSVRDAIQDAPVPEMLGKQCVRGIRDCRNCGATCCSWPMRTRADFNPVCCGWEPK
jgi:hypothetical protein